MDRFIGCYCDKDLSMLVISGEPSPVDLNSTWQAICDQFHERMQDEEQKSMGKMTMEFNLLQTKCTVLQTLVKALQFVYIPLFAEQLVHWYGMPVTLDPKNKEDFNRQLALVTARVNRWLSDAASLKKQIDDLAPAGQDSATHIDREYFDAMFVSLSSVNKYQVDRRKTTVSEFIIMVQNLRRMVAHLESEKMK